MQLLSTYLQKYETVQQKRIQGCLFSDHETDEKKLWSSFLAAAVIRFVAVAPASDAAGTDVFACVDGRTSAMASLEETAFPEDAGGAAATEVRSSELDSDAGAVAEGAFGSVDGIA